MLFCVTENELEKMINYDYIVAARLIVIQGEWYFEFTMINGDVVASSVFADEDAAITWFSELTANILKAKSGKFV